MKLSEAITVGAAKHTQGFNALVLDNRTCVLGAAAVAIGAPLDCEHMRDALLSQFGADLRGATACPAPSCTESFAHLPYIPLLTICIHLNDDHRWTREAIAAWLESEGL